MNTKKNIDFIVGDKVEVKEGTMCPDFEGLDIGGWQGSVTEVDNDENKPLILIQWNDKTLKNMPDDFIQQSEDEGLAHKLMYLYPEDVNMQNRN